MKIITGIILTIAWFLIGLCYVKARKEKHKLAVTVRRLIAVGFFIVFFNAVGLFTNYAIVNNIARCLYFVATNWLLYFLLKFSIEFNGKRFEDHVKKPVLIALLVADSASMDLNIVFNHVFDVEPVTVMGETFFDVHLKSGFYPHYAMIIFMVVCCLISLFYGCIKAPLFYRKKYFNIAIITIVIVLLNIFTVDKPIDVSVLGYIVEGVIIYYSTFVFSPQRLVQKTLLKVTDNMELALLVFDVDGNRMFNSNAANELLSTEPALVDSDGIVLEDWCRKQFMNYAEEFVRERTFTKGDEEHVLRIQLQRMKDKKHHLQGGYYIIQDRTEEIRQQREERYLATHDPLTGLYNRDSFYEKAAKYIQRFHDRELLMVCTDVKDFKMINDIFGTHNGDLVLKYVAQVLREKIKGVLTYGRISNDIFGMLILKSDFDAEMLALREREVFATSMEEISTIPLINYVGVYEIVEPDIPVSVMCDRARMAIATIKGDYYKRVAYYDNELRENLVNKQELINDLRHAISDGQIKMYLQPQMSAEQKLLGAEALMRWEHPVKGRIMPGEFIPIFEENGLISEVDKHIWETACKQLRDWKERGINDIYISVNISPRDFYFLDIFEIFKELSEKYKINPGSLKLEITETAMVMDFKRQLEFVSKLRNMGFAVEMDDFGSGYSSLNMLKDINVDVLKIDMAFLKKAEDEERSRKILQMIILLAKQLGMPVITEGVETEAQVKFLTEMGCEIFQGYYFGKPMPVEEFEQKFLS